MKSSTDSRVRSAQAFCIAVLGLAVAGCSLLPSRHHAPAEPPIDTTESGTVHTYLALADLREDGADWTGAQAVVDKALAQQPGSRAALVRRAQLLLILSEDGDVPEPREAARAILVRVGAAGDDPETRATAAWLAFDDGQRDDAVAAARAAADVEGASPRVTRIAAYLLLRNGDAQGAKSAAERAVELAPRSAAALRLRARTRLAVGDLGGAASDARDALRNHRDDPESSAVLADALLRQADDKGAQRVLAAVPDARRNAHVLVPLARLTLGTGDAAAGRALLEQAVRAHPNDPDVHQALVALDIREGRAADSVARLDAAVAARPNDAALHRLHGQALVAAHDDAAAGAAFARSLALDPNELATYRALLEWLGTSGPTDTAERRIAELGLDAGPTLFAVGLLHEGRGDRSGGRAHIQKALEAAPDLVVARMALAASLVATGEQLDQALALAQTARAARPGDPQVADTVGMVHLRRGQASAARDPLGEAVGGVPIWDPGFADVVYHRAMALEATGDRNGARRDAEVALAVVGDRKPAPPWVGNARAVVERAKPAPVAKEGGAPPPVKASEPAATAAKNTTAATTPTSADAAPPTSGAATAPATSASSDATSQPAPAPVEAPPDKPSAP